MHHAITNQITHDLGINLQAAQNVVPMLAKRLMEEKMVHMSNTGSAPQDVDVGSVASKDAGRMHEENLEEVAPAEQVQLIDEQIQVRLAANNKFKHCPAYQTKYKIRDAGYKHQTSSTKNNT